MNSTARLGVLRNMVLIASAMADSGDGPVEGEVTEEVVEEEEEARQRYAAVENRKRCIGLPGA